MPATNADIKYYGGSDGAPANDVDPAGGAIDTGAELVEATAGIVIAAVPAASGSDEDYYGVAYRKNEHVSSDWTDAALTNRAGAILPASAGQVSVVSTSASDTGVLRVTGLISAAWDQEDITLTGTTPATGAETWDSGEVWRYEYLSGGVPATPVGNLTIDVDGEVVATIYGSASGFGNIMASAEFELALASNLDDDISLTNRLTAPTVGAGAGQVSAFSRAVKWSGTGAVDQSLAVPGGDLGFGVYVGYCIHLIAKDGIPAPAGGNLVCDPNLFGVGA